MRLKTLFLYAAIIGVLPFYQATGQGTFLYDQQSSVEGLTGEFGLNIISSQPAGQSFTPSLSSIGFVRLLFSNGGVGGSIHLNIRSNSISGQILGVSSTLVLPDSYKGYVDFVFPTNVQVVPENAYFFETVVQSGTGWFLNYYNGFGYARGNMVAQGSEQPPFDLWFREGIVVPEPSATVLMLAGLASIRFIRRSRK